MKHKLTRILIDGIGCAAIGVVFFFSTIDISTINSTKNLHNLQPTWPTMGVVYVTSGMSRLVPISGDALCPGLLPFFSGVITLFGRLVGG